MRFVVIGAGMAGVLSGIRLHEAGYDNWVIYEKGDSVGGTWTGARIRRRCTVRQRLITATRR